MRLVNENLLSVLPGTSTSWVLYGILIGVCGLTFKEPKEEIHTHEKNSDIQYDPIT